MAYVFNRLNNMLAGEEETQPQGTDIFAGDQGGSGPSQGGEGGTSQPQVKTSTEGDLSSGGGGTATTSENMPQDMKKQDTRILKRNVGKVSTPEFTKTLGENLSKADQDLQAEADSYMQKATERSGTYGVDDQTIDGAVSGDEEATNKVTSAIQAAPVDYDDFIPETQYNFNEVQDLSSSQGLQRLLKNEARGRLSAKELEFDRGILERSPEFLKIREMLRGQQSTLSDKAGKLSTDNTAAAQKQIDDAIAAAKASVETGLGGRRDDLIKANEAEAAAINAKREEMRKAGIPKDIQDRILGIRKEEADRFDDSLRLDDLLLQANLNPADYLNWGGQVGMNDMVDEQEAARFNRILQLLGKGGQTWTAGRGAGDDYTFDEAKAREALVSGAQAERVKRDTDMKSEQKKILDAIKARLASENDARRRAFEEHKAMTIQKIMDANRGMDWNRIDLNQFFKGPGQLSMSQMFKSEEAARLNELARLLGGQGSYKAGSYGDFERADTNAIQEYLNGLKFQSRPNNTSATVMGSGVNTSGKGYVADAAAKGPNNTDPNYTIEQAIKNPVATVKASVPKSPKKPKLRG